MQNLMCFSCCLIMRQRKIFIGGTKPYHDPLLRFFNGRGEGESLAVSPFQCSDIVYGCFFFNNNRRAFSTRDGIYAILFFLKKQLVSDSSLEVLFSYMKKMELPKKHLLIHGGVLDRHVYFIEKGFCRSYC